MLSITTLKTIPYNSKVLYISPLTEVVWGHGADVAILNTLLKSKPYANDFNAKLEKVSEFIKEEFKPSKDEGISVETLEKALVCVEDKLRDRQSFKGIRLQFILPSMVASRKSEGNVFAHINKNGNVMGYTITLFPMDANHVEPVIRDAINICIMDLKLTENSMMLTNTYRPGDTLTRVYNLSKNIDHNTCEG